MDSALPRILELSGSAHAGSWSSPLSALIAAMPLLSTPQTRARTQNNLFGQCNIISIPLANSLFPIAEVPLSKFA